MDYDTLLNEVLRRAHLGSTGDAQRVIRAVTETFGERLGDHEQQDVRAQLPRQMKGWIHQRTNGEPFDLNQFYDRVADRADVLTDQAAQYTCIVLGLFHKLVSPGEMTDVLATLTDEYREILMAQPSPC